MNKNSIISTINSLGALASKHLPDILVGVGVVAGVATVVSTAKQTMNVPDILDEAKEELDEVKSNAEVKQGKEIAKVYAKTGFKLVKNYAKPICFGAISITSVLYSHGMMKKRNAQALAAAATYESMFSNLYKSVAEKYGVEEAQKLRYGMTEEKLDIVSTDENGKETHKKQKANVIRNRNLDEISDYALIFDELNPNWSKFPGDNHYFLQRVQAMANDRLAIQGHLFLNEVCDLGGWPRTKAGQVVGWTRDGKNSGGRVVFSCLDYYNLTTADAAFINGYEPSVLVDFNLDGVIINDIGLTNV